ncbi:MAG: NADH-quinone oxidoreductase subunit NuoE [Firmicutes bacterium]|nr:NADH-quinone oxidoreductase subunit NuoE [Bacillota bacterium]
MKAVEKTAVLTSGTVPKESLEILQKYKGGKGALIPALQELQANFGYLPEPVLEEVAKHLNLPLSKVYGVATFYAQFHLSPRGLYVIRLCTGTACHVRGSGAIMQKIRSELGLKPGETTADGRFTLEPVACLGACGQAPVMMVNDDTHGRLTPEMALSVLESYK